MSEVIRTERVEIEDTASSENHLSLGDLLAGVGWLAYQGTKLAVKGTIAGAKLAGQAVESLRESNQRLHSSSSHLSLSKAEAIVKESPDTAFALMSLASEPGMAVPKSEILSWKERIRSFSSSSNKEEVLLLAGDLIRARQSRLQASTAILAAEACSAIGFVPKTLKGQTGLVTALSTDGGRRITVEVQKGRDGDLRMHFDAHGFRGGECTKALDALQGELKKRGVRFQVDSRQRKDRGPVLDGSRFSSRQSSRGSR